MEKKKLLEIRDVIEDIKNKGINETNIKKIKEVIDENGISIYFNTFHPTTAAFNPEFRMISVNLESMKNWLEKNLETYKYYCDESNKDLLNAYFATYIMAHELEHSKQFCTAMDFIKPKYAYRTQAYLDIYDIILSNQLLSYNFWLFLKNSLKLRLYKKNEYNYIIERNANIEGFNLVHKISKVADEDSRIQKSMYESKLMYTTVGYLNSPKGALYETYKGLKILDKYERLKLPQKISLSERLREGLPIKEQERILLLKKVKNVKIG